MPERIIPIIDAIFMTFISIGIFISSISFITVIPTILAVLYWIGKIKKGIEKDHHGSILEWLKYLISKKNETK